MNKLILVAVAGLCFGNIYAKNPKKDKAEEGFVFTTVKENPITSIKNQNRSSTCWSFSSLGFLESELLREGKGEFDLSEMFVVHKTMEDRAVNYVRYHGDASFSPGGSFEDIVFCYKNYGMVPQDVMPGIEYGDSLPNHNELDAVAGAYVQAIGKGNQSKLSPVWKKGVTAIYDTYLGECPKEFTYKGKTYTPRTFADEVLGLNMNDYVSLTSYTHHPFYQTFSIEVQDNWRNALSYNLPIDELMEVMDNAINNGYTFAWGADVSEEGFTRDGHDFSDPEVLRASIADSAILVNGTSVGMAPKTENTIITDTTMFHKDLFVFDVIYNPQETRLLREAKEAGCKTGNGMYMLLYQGAASFKLWTGEEMPVEIIKEKYFS